MSFAQEIAIKESLKHPIGLATLTFFICTLGNINFSQEVVSTSWNFNVQSIRKLTHWLKD